MHCRDLRDTRGMAPSLPKKATTAGEHGVLSPTFRPLICAHIMPGTWEGQAAPQGRYLRTSAARLLAAGSSPKCSHGC